MCDAQDVDVLGEASQTVSQRTNSDNTVLRAAIVAAVLLAAVDQVTKRWALAALEPGSCAQPDACIDLFAGVRLHLVFNTGAAFTTGSGFGPLLAVLAFVMIGVLLVMAAKRPDRRGAVLLGIIAGGAAGNLADRVFRADDGLFSGAVVDFIDLGWWPVFNIADVAIVVGVIAVIAATFFEDASSQEPSFQESE